MKDFTRLSGEKANPIKPNSNLIPERPKMNVNPCITMYYKDFVPMVSKKQTQNKPSFLKG
jgi:hypothetical protein